MRAMSNFEIIKLSDERKADSEEWQSYARGAAMASLYHRIEWKNILQLSFGHRCHYLMARHEGAIRGLLPLVEMRSVLFGHFFVSLPFLNYGGIVADDPEYSAALATAAAKLTTERGGTHLELRQEVAQPNLNGNRWIMRNHKAALVVQLKRDPAAHWSKLSSRLRGKVRKAEKLGASFSLAGEEFLEEFYKVFAINMRNLGTPVHSRSFFQNIFALAGNARLLIVRRNGEPVAAALALARGTKVELPWICSDYRHSGANVNEYLYWNAIAWACRSGAKELDLGRSSINAGTYKFKLQWNPTVVPLFWYYWRASEAELPRFDPHNPRYALAIECWKRFPMMLANWLGPSIIRNIP